MNKASIISSLAICFFSILMYISIKLLFLDGTPRMLGRLYLKKIYTDKSIKLTDRYVYDILKNDGLSISLKDYYKIYQKLRFLLLILIAVCFIKIAISRAVVLSEIIAIALFMLLYCSRLKIGRHYTLVGLIFNELDKSMKNKLDKEICSIIVQLQNISESQNGNSFNLVHMLTSISRFARLTKNAFIRMISNININDMDQAKAVFDEEINTALAKDFSSIIIKLDYIQPKEVKKQLKVLEERAKNHDNEIRYKNAEFVSNLLYLLPTILCFIILMNFLRIVMTLVTNLIPM